MPLNRRGNHHIGERPIPGMSNTITSRSCSASMKGKTSSRFAPMPLNSSSGVLPRPLRIATRSITPSTSTYSIFGAVDRLFTTQPAGRYAIVRRANSTGLELCKRASSAQVRALAARSSVLMHVASRRWIARRMRFAPEMRRRRALAGAAPLVPLEPVVPPRSGMRRRRLEPLLGREREVGIEKVLRLGVSRRVDDALDVTARAQDESHRSAQHLARLVARRPRRDVIRDARDDIAVDVDVRHVDCSAEDLE